MVLIWASSSSLAAVLEVVLELEGGVEVILDGALVAAGDEDDLREPGGHRLLDHVLDRGLVHQGQHFLRLRLGGGQEPRAESGRGEDRLAYAHAGAPIRRRRSGPVLPVECFLDAAPQLVLDGLASLGGDAAVSRSSMSPPLHPDDTLRFRAVQRARRLAGPAAPDLGQDRQRLRHRRLARDGHVHHGPRPAETVVGELGELAVGHDAQRSVGAGARWPPAGRWIPPSGVASDLARRRRRE